MKSLIIALILAFVGCTQQMHDNECVTSNGNLCFRSFNLSKKTLNVIANTVLYPSNIKDENALYKHPKRYNYFVLCITVTMTIVFYAVLSYSCVGRMAKKTHESHRRDKECILSLQDALAKQIAESEKLKLELVKIKRDTLLLKTENSKIKENNNDAHALHLIKNLRQGTLIVERMTKEERHCLVNSVNLFYGDSIIKLKEQYSLNERNIMLVVLMKLGFDNRMLEIAYDCEINSVYRKKQRLRECLKISRYDDLENFIRTI